MKSRFSISVIVVAAALAVGVATEARAVAIALQNATASYSLTDYGWGGIASSANGIDDGSIAGDGWHTYLSSHGDVIGCYETATDLSGDQWTFVLSNQNLYRSTGEPDENSATKKFRISYTTDNRDTFADGLQNGGAVAANWTVMTPASATAEATTATINGDGSISWTAPNPVYTTDRKTVVYNASLANVTGFRVELLSTGPNAGEGLGWGNGIDATVVTEFSGSVVPEPSAIVLVASGLVGLLAYAWRKRR